MKFINYAGTVKIETGDAIANAVIWYAAALYENKLSDVVSVPTSDAHGWQCCVELLLAPSLGVALEPAPDDELEPDDEAFVRELSRRSEALRSVHMDGAARGADAHT